MQRVTAVMKRVTKGRVASSHTTNAIGRLKDLGPSPSMRRNHNSRVLRASRKIESVNVGKDFSNQPLYNGRDSDGDVDMGGVVNMVVDAGDEMDIDTDDMDVDSMDVDTEYCSSSSSSSSSATNSSAYPSPSTTASTFSTPSTPATSLSHTTLTPQSAGSSFSQTFALTPSPVNNASAPLPKISGQVDGVVQARPRAPAYNSQPAVSGAPPKNGVLSFTMPPPDNTQQQAPQQQAPQQQLAQHAKPAQHDPPQVEPPCPAIIGHFIRAWNDPAQVLRATQWGSHVRAAAYWAAIFPYLFFPHNLAPFRNDPAQVFEPTPWGSHVQLAEYWDPALNPPASPAVAPAAQVEQPQASPASAGTLAGEATQSSADRSPAGLRGADSAENDTAATAESRATDKGKGRAVPDKETIAAPEPRSMDKGKGRAIPEKVAVPEKIDLQNGKFRIDHAMQGAQMNSPIADSPSLPSDSATETATLPGRQITTSPAPTPGKRKADEIDSDEDPDVDTKYPVSKYLKLRATGTPTANGAGPSAPASAPASAPVSSSPPSSSPPSSTPPSSSAQSSSAQSSAPQSSSASSSGPASSAASSFGPSSSTQPAVVACLAAPPLPEVTVLVPQVTYDKGYADDMMDAMFYTILPRVAAGYHFRAPLFDDYCRKAEAQIVLDRLTANELNESSFEAVDKAYESRDTLCRVKLYDLFDVDWWENDMLGEMANMFRHNDTIHDTFDFHDLMKDEFDEYIDTHPPKTQAHE